MGGRKERKFGEEGRKEGWASMMQYVIAISSSYPVSQLVVAGRHKMLLGKFL